MREGSPEAQAMASERGKAWLTSVECGKLLSDGQKQMASGTKAL